MTRRSRIARGIISAADIRQLLSQGALQLTAQGKWELLPQTRSGDYAGAEAVLSVGDDPDNPLDSPVQVLLRTGGDLVSDSGVVGNWIAQNYYFTKDVPDLVEGDWSLAGREGNLGDYWVKEDVLDQDETTAGWGLTLAPALGDADEVREEVYRAFASQVEAQLDSIIGTDLLSIIPHLEQALGDPLEFDKTMPWDMV